jgi:hypothetical protein
MPKETELQTLRRKLNAAHVSRDWHKSRAATLAGQVRELKDAHKRGFEEGSKAATLLTYLAVSDFGTDGTAWISDRISAVIAGKKLPAPLSNEIENAVTASVIESMKRYSPKRAAQVEASFQKFIVGDSNS